MLAVVGGTGGVGTTTVALGVASAMARDGADPVVLDADRTMPDLGRRAGIGGGGVAGYAAGAPLSAVARPAPRLDDPGRVLPAAPGLDGDATRAALERLRSATPAALVDCPAGVGPATATPLRLADGALVVTAPRERALHGAVTAASMARALETPPLGAVVVGTDDPPVLEPLLDCPVVGSVPTVDRPLRAAPARRAYEAVSSAIGARTFMAVDRTVT